MATCRHQYPGLPTTLEDIWCGTSPARTQQCVYADILWHPHISATSAVCSGWTAMQSLPGVLSSSMQSLSSPSAGPKTRISGGNMAWDFTGATLMRTHPVVLCSSVPSRSSLSVHPGDGLRQGDVRSGVPREQYIGCHAAFSSYMLPLTLARGFRRCRRGPPYFLKGYFAAMWNCLDGPGILSVAAEMLFILIFNSVQAFSIVVRRRLSAGRWSSAAAESLIAQGIGVTIGSESGILAKLGVSWRRLARALYGSRQRCLHYQLRWLTRPLPRHDGHLPPVGLPTALEEIGCGTSPAVCS